MHRTSDASYPPPKTRCDSPDDYSIIEPQEDLEEASQVSDKESLGDIPDEDEDERGMGESGDFYNDSDRRMMARYIAARGEYWNELTAYTRWQPFYEKVGNSLRDLL